MLSDSPQLDRLTADLVAALTAVLPDDWEFVDVDSKVTTALGVVLYYEQGDLVTTINGGPVPTGLVGVEYTLTLAAPETDPQMGTARVTDAVVSLLPALDSLASLYWDRAEKVRLSTGETTYRLAVVNLSSYTAETTNPEPDPVPDEQPEEA